MNYDEVTFDKVSLWIKQNVGKTFTIRGVRHYDKKLKRIVHAANPKDPDKLEKYLKWYINKTSGIDTLPQVEFSEDYQLFKIYNYES